MVNKKLFIIDLDGTTLIGLNNIHPDFVRDAKKVLKAGHIIVIATGRSFNAAIKFYNIIGLSTLLINCNGNFITNPFEKDHSKRFLVKNTFPSSIIKNLLSEKKFKKGINNFIIESNETLKATPEISEKIKVWFDKMPLKKIKLNDKIEDEEILTSMIFVDREIQAEVYKYLVNINGISIYVVDNWSNNVVVMEIFSSKGTKGKGVTTMQSIYGINNENTHVFGDSYNDISMFDLIGVNSYAVQNAVDDLKNISSEVLKETNLENAVGKKILKIIKQD